MNKGILSLLLTTIFSLQAFADWDSVKCEALKCIGCAVQCTIRENGQNYVATFTQANCLELNLTPRGDRAQCAKRIEECINSSSIKKISEFRLMCE
jgi:hypothetical protein